VALQFEDGRIFCGRYAENAAFNPSLPPMQMACAHAVLGGEDLATVRRAVLLESKDGQISQRDSAQSTLKALGSVELEYKAVLTPASANGKELRLPFLLSAPHPFLCASGAVHQMPSCPM
jgi:hypothetical protein